MGRGDGALIDPSALIAEYLKSATSPSFDRLLGIVCGEFASRLGAPPPGFLRPVAGGAPGPAWLREAIGSSGPEDWAWALSSVIPGPGGRERGAVSTLPSLASLMCRLAIEEYGPLDGSVSIVDPAVGGGAFVLAMASELDGSTGGPRSWAVGRVRGVDLDESCVRAAKASAWLWSLAGWNGAGRWDPPCMGIFTGDSLLEDDEWWASGPGSPGSFDLLVANPPYVRQELVGAARKAALAGKYAGLGGRTDMYARFFMLANRLLRPGGVGVFVTPVSWMDVEYGSRVKQFLLDNFEIRSVLASGETRWFPQASINAQITVMRRRGGPGETVSGEAVSTVRFMTTDGAGARTVRVPQSSLRPADKWGVYFRGPSVYFSLLDDIMKGRTPGFCRLSDLATVSFGTKTGANDFFYLRDAGATPEGRRLLASAGSAAVRAVRPLGASNTTQTILIETGLLKPVVKSLRDVNGYRVDRRNIGLWALAVDPDSGANALDAAGFAKAYVQMGVDMGYSSRPTCRNRRPWYRIPQPPADMLYSMSWGSRMGVALNDPECLYDARLYGIRVREGIDPLELAAALNATCTWLFTEVNGRPMTGSLPLLDIKIYEVERLPVLDVRRLDAGRRRFLAKAMRGLLRRDMLDIVREVELEDRRRLDVAVLEMAGYAGQEAEALAAEIGECVATMVRRRISKSRRVIR